jgi:peroxiredoxin
MTYRNVTVLPLLILSLILFSGSAFAAGPEIGATAPDFTLTDTNGDTHSLSDFAGKIVVLEWTNPNCPFVVRHYRDDLMPALQRKYGEKGVVWLVINSTHPEHRDYETNESLNTIFTGWNEAYTAQLVDLDGSVGRAYEAQTTPHMYVIDTEGVLHYNGAIDDDPRGNKEFDERVQYLEDALKKVMEGEEVGTATTRPYGCTVKYTKDT